MEAITLTERADPNSLPGVVVCKPKDPEKKDRFACCPILLLFAPSRSRKGDKSRVPSSETSPNPINTTALSPESLSALDSRFKNVSVALPRAHDNDPSLTCRSEPAELYAPDSLHLLGSGGRRNSCPPTSCLKPLVAVANPLDPVLPAPPSGASSASTGRRKSVHWDDTLEDKGTEPEVARPQAVAAVVEPPSNFKLQAQKERALVTTKKATTPLNSNSAAYRLLQQARNNRERMRT
mmetsp:Transcript_21926/g.36323  ORF Transcript_21926/g.36323 Transcript_21926/m.36323 type:complete len:237 (-) Transcript_21926:558-1268(-)